MKARLCLFLFVFLSGCAIAPVANHVSARTNGKNESLLSLGTMIGSSSGRFWLPSLKYSVGLSDDFDVGGQYEIIDIGLWGKYAIVNHKEGGFSMAALGGVGVGGDGHYIYFGPVLSWLHGIFEPYLLSRFNYVSYPAKNLDLGTIGEVTILNGVYRYFQHTLGFFLWPTKKLGVSLEASSFSTLDSPFIFAGKDKFLYSGSFHFRF